MPYAQFAQQTIRLQFDKNIHFGDDASITLAKAGGDVIDTVTLRVDWPSDMPTAVQYSVGTAMIDRVELIYKDQLIERHYGESMFLLGEVSISERKQYSLSNLIGTRTTSNLASYYIQFPFSIKLPICVLDEAPTLRIIFQSSEYFSGVKYTRPIQASLFVNYIYVTNAEREYLKKTQLFYPVKTFQRVQFRIPYTSTIFSCETSFVNMVKEIFWVIQEDQYTSNIYNYSDDLVSLRLTLDGDEIISSAIGTPSFLSFMNNHTRSQSAKFYSYSFELDPELDEENGAMNMSAVTRQLHAFTLTPTTLWRTLRIYAHSYNIFKVDKGDGKSMYPMQEAGVPTYESGSIIPWVQPPAPPTPLYIFDRIFDPLQSYLYFGQSLALNNTGTRAVIGAAGTGQNTGTVIVYKKDGSTWDTGSALVSGLGSNSYFGYSVDISNDGNTVITGTPAALGGRGYVSVYKYIGGVWDGGTPLPVDPGVISYMTTYGWSVAINSTGDVAVIGAPRAFGFQGYVCVFRYSGGSWDSGTPLVSTAGTGTTFFGYSVSINEDGTKVVVGAPSACYAAVYTYSGGIWGTATTINSGLPITANFGWSVYCAPLGTKIIVGAPNSEYAAVFTEADSWTTGTELTSTAGSGAEFGSAVALSADGNTALVGASIKGYVAAYQYIDATWSAANIIENTTNQVTSRFGSALSISHDGFTALVGAYGYDNANGYAALFTSVNV